MLTRHVVHALSIVVLIASHAGATDFTWTGSASTSWINPENWLPASDNEYPDDAADTATIPQDYTGSNYPVFDDSAARTIKSYRVLNGNTARAVNVLEIATPGSGSRVLKIADPDGLDPGQGNIKLNKSTELWHLGGGLMSVWGDVEFDSSGASASQRPQFVLGEGTTLHVRYIPDEFDAAGSFKSAGALGGLIRGQVGQDDLTESLILRPPLKGSFAVDVGLVSLAEVTTNDGDDNTANTIRLSCLPKVCVGYAPSADKALDVVGHEGAPGTVIIDAVTLLRPSSNMLSINVGNYGVLKVNRHCSAPRDLTLASGGRIEVKSKVLFTVGGPVYVCEAPTSP